MAEKEGRVWCGGDGGVRVLTLAERQESPLIEKDFADAEYRCRITHD
jgi:hypothetical protein